MAIKVVQWGTGTAGLRALRSILDNPALELVGLYVARPERAGRDAGSFLDLSDVGLAATHSLEELLAVPADCLCYMGSYARGGVDDVIPFLRAGRNVVTPSLGMLLTPQFAPPDAYGPVAAACRDGAASFFSTGASPGFCTDYFPMAMLGVVDEINEITVQEIADYSTYPVVEVARSWGFGAPPERPIPLFQTDWLEKTWASVPRDIARRLGVEIEGVRVVHEIGVADRELQTAFYPIPAGTVAAVRFQVQGLVRDEVFVTLEHVNYCDYGSMPAHWPRPDSRSSRAYRTVVRGRPNLAAEISLDYPVAAVRTVNAIPAVVAAPPGVLAGADVAALSSGNVVIGRRA